MLLLALHGKKKPGNTGKLHFILYYCMPALKRLFAILFLSVLLFNLYGYQLLINHWQEREETAFEQELHTNLQEDELVSIKLPAALPPYSDNLENLEWIDGEITVNGTIYKYVKRRIFKDSIEFLCVPHTARMRMENAREDFFRLCNDLQAAPSQEESRNTSPVKPLVFEFCSDVVHYQIESIKDKQKDFTDIYRRCKPIKKQYAIEHPPEPPFV